MKKRNTIFIGLNELNFTYIKKYIGQGHLPSIKALLEKYDLVETTSETDYSLLEPWIQWVTIYTGKDYAEHQVFRLGDIVDRKDLKQIFEELEESGKSIGAVSPFNADNRLKVPQFFVPDPWTITKCNGGSTLKGLYSAIHQAVNENAQSKLGLTTIKNLLFGILKYVPFTRYVHYVRLVLNRKKTWG